MRYEEALAFIHGAYGIGEKRGLTNMTALMDRLGSPHRAFPSVHVAGTNGKGSVCAFLSAATRRAGYRTGLYTSPFLQRYNERMRIDGKPIADERLASLTEEVAAATEALRAEGIRPTEFEIGTAIAFLYFAREQVDIAIIEVGLGGRLDPTNIITPRVSVIAAIDLDHTKVLGNTVEAVAQEKAGIIKERVPVVTSAQNEKSVLRVISDVAKTKNATVRIAEPTVGFALSLSGKHQTFNAGSAYTTLHLLAENGFSALTEPVIVDAFAATVWPGRLEHLTADGHSFLLDGAHNAHGARALTTYVQAANPPRTLLICGILQDKDWQGMVHAFAAFADMVLTVSPDNHRALAENTLAEAFAQEGVAAKPAESLACAIEIAKREANENDWIVIAGSLYLVGEARALLAGDMNIDL